MMSRVFRSYFTRTLLSFLDIPVIPDLEDSVQEDPTAQIAIAPRLVVILSYL